MDNFSCRYCEKRYESFSAFQKEAKSFLNFPKFKNTDNIVMLVQLNQELVNQRRFKAYFLKANELDKSKLFKNLFKYKIIGNNIELKSKSPSVLLNKYDSI